MTDGHQTDIRQAGLNILYVLVYTRRKDGSLTDEGGRGGSIQICKTTCV
jgi:hypothetical protein